MNKEQMIPKKIDILYGEVLGEVNDCIARVEKLKIEMQTTAGHVDAVFKKKLQATSVLLDSLNKDVSSLVTAARDNAIAESNLEIKKTAIEAISLVAGGLREVVEENIAEFNKHAARNIRTAQMGWMKASLISFVSIVVSGFLAFYIVVNKAPEVALMMNPKLKEQYESTQRISDVFALMTADERNKMNAYLASIEKRKEKEK